MHREVLDGDPLDTHPARHPQSFENSAWGSAAADRSRRAVLAVHTMRRAEPRETVPLHDTGGALALADAGHIDDIAHGEDVSAELLTEAVFGCVAGADFDQMLTRCHACLIEVPGTRLGQLLGLDRAEAELNC